MKILTYPNFAEMASALPTLWQGPNIGLSGGSTFEKIFLHWVGVSSQNQSNKNSMDFKQFQYFPVDERLVPMNHPDSNWGMTQRLFFNPLGIPGQLGHWANSVAGFEKIFNQKMGNPPLLSTVLLGMGEDGHTASLFPGDEVALTDTTTYIREAGDAFHKHPRFTLSLRSLWEAPCVILVLTGEKKAKIFSELWSDPKSTMPVVVALRGCKNAFVVSDWVIKSS